MNRFQKIKEEISMVQFVETTGIPITKSNMISCIFHTDKTPSMKLYDDHFHCFGCGAHGDIINFASALYNISLNEASIKIANDFNLYHKND